MRFPLLARIAVVAAVALALLIALALIKGKVVERRNLADQTQSTFATETSGAQAIAGPIIAVACLETYLDERVVHRENGKPLTVREKRQRACPPALLLPKQLSVDGHVEVEQRYRGIFPIRFFRSKLAFSGDFDLPALPQSPGDVSRQWTNAALLLGVKDVRGIKNAPVLGLAANREFQPGIIYSGIKSGLHVELGSYPELQRRGAMPFAFDLELVGTERLVVAPVGDQNTVRLASAWQHPSFTGGYLPDKRDISADGFSAAWSVNHFATGGDNFWRGVADDEKVFANPRLLGVALVEPVNIYSLSYRATEYGFLFVLFTFAAFALVEIAWGVRLHAIQYGLAGLALAVFFLLLIALSEHFAFSWSYAVAATACVALLTYYLRQPLGTGRRTSVLGAMFTALYGVLYVLLRSEDHALLLGSLLVFAALAAAMVLTRKLNLPSLAAAGRA